MVLIELNRWEEAQKVELENWQRTARRLDYSLSELLDSIELNRFTQKNQKEQKLSFDRVLEIGIGPLGIGWGGLFANGAVVGVEPLPILQVRTKNAQFNEFVTQLQKCVSIVKGVGEKLPFSHHVFDTVVCDNVIDHSYQPSLIIQEAYRVLRPRGHLILGVNCFSIFGIIKWDFYTARRFPDSFGVVAHPHSYLAKDLKKLVQEVGFKVCTMSEESLLKRWIGHSHRVYVIAAKSPSISYVV